jgi:hypothetical protein
MMSIVSSTVTSTVPGGKSVPGDCAYFLIEMLIESKVAKGFVVLVGV